MNKSRLMSALAFALALLLPSSAFAAVRVLLIGYPTSPGWIEDVRNKIVGTGLVDGTVDIFDIRAGTPTPGQLGSYDVAFVYTDGPALDANLLGNRLADFVDNGGGVVEATFGFYSGSPGVLGRWQGDNYKTLQSGSQSSGSNLGIGARHIPKHPILAGVSSFRGGTAAFHNIGAPSAGTFRVADWADGQPLILTREGTLNGKIAGLNFYPVSNAMRVDLWDAASDGARLMANAINYVSQPRNRVLVCGAPAVSGWSVETVAGILRTGRVGGPIDLFDVSSGTPTRTQLAQYDSVLVFTDAGPADPVTLGEHLADFVDRGGGVVMMAFADLVGPAGRFLLDGYSPFVASNFTAGTPDTIGARQVPGHPILTDVATFNGGSSSYQQTGAIRNGSRAVASWSGGQPLVSTNDNHLGRVASLNFYPPSNLSRADFWDSATDGSIMMANALNYAGRKHPRVLIAGTPGDPAWNLEVRAKLASTGILRGDIDIINISSDTPTIDQLRGYDAVLFFTDFGAADPNTLGNNLAQYVDEGGGVVVMTFADCFGVGGRWISEGYSPLNIGDQDQGTPMTIGARHVPGHPILANVVTFSGGSSSYHSTGALRGEAFPIADWSNGMPLVATRNGLGGNVAALNFFPPSSDSRGDFWSVGTNGDILMANALYYVATHAPCAADFNADGFVDFFDFGAFVDCFEGLGCPPGRSADVNGDGFVDFFDADAFLEAFESGC